MVINQFSTKKARRLWGNWFNRRFWTGIRSYRFLLSMHLIISPPFCLNSRQILTYKQTYSQCTSYKDRELLFFSLGYTVERFFSPDHRKQGQWLYQCPSLFYWTTSTQFSLYKIQSPGCDRSYYFAQCCVLKDAAYIISSASCRNSVAFVLVYRHYCISRKNVLLLLLAINTSNEI